MSAATQARRLRTADELSIVAFDRGHYSSYSACGIPYWFGGDVYSIQRLVVRTPEEHAKRDIDVRLGHDVLGIDLAERTVRVRRSEDGEEFSEPFDKLLVATGAKPYRPALPGVDALGIYGVQTLDDAEEIQASLDKNARYVTVVGGGYIGLEMAEALVRKGLTVTLIEQADQPMSTLDPDMGAKISDALRSSGVQLRTGVKVTGFDVGADNWVHGVITDGETIETDIVVLGMGVRPQSDLARDAGLPIGARTGGIVTDDGMRVVGHDGVWAAGDCVEMRHLVTGEPTAIALGTHANKQGRVAGITIGGGQARFPGVVGTAVTRICEWEIGRTGLNEAEATAAGIDYVVAAVDATNKAGYFPGVRGLTVKVLAERGTGRLLGGQIVGKEGAAKRIDTLAVALTARMTLEDVLALDLGYAPPFGPVWDPVQVAARKALTELG